MSCLVHTAALLSGNPEMIFNNVISISTQYKYNHYGEK